MRNTLKVALFFAILVAVLLLVPSICNAAVVEADPATQDLVDVVNSANDGDTVKLLGDFEIDEIIVVSGKTITIDGDGNTISGNVEAISQNGQNNQSLITANLEGATIYLQNVELTSSPKYGVQAYFGGKVVLDGVNIHDCNYGGVLNNCGTVEIVDLYLGYNGENGNNGIEMSKGQSLADEQVQPTLVMNGTLESNQTENVIYIAEDAADTITSFTVENAAGTTDKLLLDGNKVVVTDENNSKKFESNSNDRVTAENTTGEEYVPNPVVRLEVAGLGYVDLEVLTGSVLTEEVLENAISELTGTKFTVEGFFVDNKYTTKYDFATEINGDTTIYVNVAEVATEEPTEPSEEIPADEKDETPKTGAPVYVGAAVVVAVLSLASIIVLKKKN